MSAGTRRIICVGNRLAPRDDAGPRVHDALARTPLPANVELIDGGLRGLDLLPFVEGAGRVVFVDNVKGLGRPGEIVVLAGDALAEGPAPSYGHSDGLSFLLHALPVVCAGDLPELVLVGVEGAADDAAVQAMAAECMRLAGR